MNFCRDREDAEEIAQDVLTSLVRSLSSYRGEASLSTWAYTVARNACLRRRRRGAAPLESLDAWREAHGAEPADPAAGPDARLERREASAALEDAIRALPPSLREAVVLRDVEGLSAREAARVTRLGERAFKSRLHRARLRLREALEPVLRPRADEDAVAARPRGGSRLPRRCPDIARYLSRHLEGDVDPALCARLEAHVRACPSCAALCGSLRSTLRTCAALRRKALPRGARAALRGALRAAQTQFDTTS
jgi:RNA polymerase sigma-70 factor (ECF subfamily)